MEKSKPDLRVITVLSKSLIISYIATAIILAILSLIFHKTDMSQSAISICIIVTYIISCFLGGFLSGKSMREKKFLWGVITGGLYFVIIILCSMFLSTQQAGALTGYTTMALICLGSGMLGGMVS